MQSVSVKPKYSKWKTFGKALVTIGKGALVLAPMVIDSLKDSGVKISGGIIIALGVIKAINNYRKNKDN